MSRKGFLQMKKKDFELYKSLRVYGTQLFNGS